MNRKGAGRILYDFWCRILWPLWFGRLMSAHSGSRAPFTTWNVRNEILLLKLISWSIIIIRCEVLALKSWYLTVPNWNFMKCWKLWKSPKHCRSWPLTCFKLLVGPRWREFHCLEASRCCASSFSFFGLLTWCEALFVGEAFRESEGGAEKMGARPFWLKISRP